MAEDSGGFLWIGTASGLNKLESLDVKRIEDELVSALEGAANIVNRADRALDKADIETAAADLSALVGDLDGLRDLYLLTVADLSTTSPTSMTCS